ncbi:MAG: tetratricopeptide repeat protein [Planctomycetota bacterium]|nr:tetratricopeptide repeat protein [Planctomycetota bacterium]MDA1213109.1 tetratricopeptide repeat protein [Planctomycetota bacterium]
MNIGKKQILKNETRDYPVSTNRRSRADQFASRRVHQFLILIALMVNADASAVHAAEKLTHQYFNELRERRLFDVAEGYAIQRLSQPKLPLRLQWDLSRELATTLEEHARYVTGNEQADQWARARQVLVDLAPQMTDEAAKFMLDSESAILRVRQSGFLLEELDLFPRDKLLRDRLTQLVGEAETELKDLYVRSERLLRKITSLPSTQPNTALASELVFTAREIHSQIYAVRYFRAVSLWQQLSLQHFHAIDQQERASIENRGDAVSKSLDVLLKESTPRPNDRKKGINIPGDPEKQIRQINELLKAVADHDPPSKYTWPSRLLMIECRTIAVDPVEIERLIDAFTIRDLHETVRADLETLRARYFVHETRYDKALQAIIEYRKTQPVLPGELFYWQQKSLAGLADLAKAKRQDALTDDLLRESDTQARRAIETVGGYWGNRCLVLAEQLHESLRYGRELFESLQSARLHHRQDDLAAAMVDYQQALQFAKQNQLVDLEMELSLVAGGILLSQQDFVTAASVLHAASESHPDHAESARVDILYAYALGKNYEAEKTLELAAAYAAALEHHRQTYRSSETAGEATWMLAQLNERTGEPADAIAYYKDIPLDHPRRLHADVGMARSFEYLLNFMREPNDEDARKKLRDRQIEAESTLLALVQNYPAEGVNWNREQAEVALRTARMLLNHQPTDYERANHLLGQVLEAYAHSQSLLGEMNTADIEASQSAWLPILHAARQLRILSLAGQNQPRQAMTLVEQLAAEGPQDVLPIVLGISSITSESTPERRRQIGELQLYAAQLLQKRRDELSEIDQARLDQCLAEAYAATDQPLKSLEIYESLLKRFPKDRRLQKTTAELLIGCGSEECLRKSLTLWRSIEKKAKEGSPDWTEARYYVAWCHCELKQYEEGLKWLKVTRLLYPDLDPSWKSKFADLEQKCQKAGSGNK